MRNKELHEGREYFDGEPVQIYEGRFSGAFIMDEDDGAPMSNGDLVTFIVTARVDTPKFSRMRKTGDLKRVNAMKVEDAIPIDSERARFLYDTVGRNVLGINDGLIETKFTNSNLEDDESLAGALNFDDSNSNDNLNWGEVL